MSATCWRCRGPLDPRQDDVLMTCTECGRRWPATSSDLATLRHHAEGLAEAGQAAHDAMLSWFSGEYANHPIAEALAEKLRAWREGPGAGKGEQG